jgi:hypothetical protein
MSTSIHYRCIAALTVVALAVLSGCAAYPFVGPSCGPGESDIGVVGENASGVEIKGEVTSSNGTMFVLDDGTGQARVLPLSGVPSEVSSGDCIIVESVTTTDDADGADVLVVPSTIWKEEVVVEDSR